MDTKGWINYTNLLNIVVVIIPPPPLNLETVFPGILYGDIMSIMQSYHISNSSEHWSLPLFELKIEIKQLTFL